MTEEKVIGEMTSKAQETRQRILFAALQLFQTHGFDNTTMRDIATKAGVAVGAAYYYFKTKDDLVMAFYLESQSQSHQECENICATIPEFEGRVKAIIQAKFKQFSPHHGLFKILFRNASDPESPLSPFSVQTKAIRNQAIGLFEMAMQNTQIKISDDFRPYFPTLLWFYQMGLILYWIHDRSSNQENTFKLLENSLKIIMQLTRLSRLPLLGKLKKSVLTLLSDIKFSTQETGKTNETM